MKILSIRLKNLASLAGEHFIDFESDPLASAGLIAIVGKTGAGKSTILDAMCLALFNRVPRLKDSDGKLTDVDGSELQTNSPMTVLRRGTGHGFAELCFVAQDQKHYLARWEIKRARENPVGKLQNTQRYLKCLTDGTVIADKSKAVEEQIKLITQLSFEQFTRAVLLAQSEVTAFLKARDNERGELLEYLTNSNIFGKIGELAFRKTADIAKQRKQLEDVLGHIEVLSDQDLTQLTQQTQQSAQVVKQIELQKQQLEQQHLWFKQQQKLDTDINSKQQLYETGLKAHQDLSPEREQLQRLERFSEIRSNVFQQQQQQKLQQQLAPQIQQAQALFTQFKQQFDAEKNNHDQAEHALNHVQAFEQQHELALKQIRLCVQQRDFIKIEYQKTKEKLTRLEQRQAPFSEQQQKLQLQIQQQTQQLTQLDLQLQSSQQFAALDHGLDAHIHQLQQFIVQYQNIEKNLKEQNLADISAAEQQLKQQQTQLSQWVTQFGTPDHIETQLERDRILREQKIAQLNEYALIQQKLELYFGQQNEVQQLQHKQQQFKQQSQQLSAATQQAQQDFLAAKAERTQQQQVLQQQLLLHAENIENLRADLKDGEACVVCGSTQHPYRDDASILSKALFELQQQQEQQAEIKEQTVFNQWQMQQQSLTQCNTALEQVTADITGTVQQAAATQLELRQDIASHQLPLDLKLQQSEITDQVTQLHTTQQQQISSLEATIQSAAQALKEQQRCEQQIHLQQHFLASAAQLLNQVEHIFQADTIVQQHAPNQSRSQHAQHILQSLHARALQLGQLQLTQKQCESLQQQLKILQVDQENLNQQISESKQALQEISTLGQENSDAATQLIENITGLAAQKPHEWLTQYDLQQQQCQSTYRQLKQSYEQLRQAFEQQKNELDQLNAQQQQNQKNLQLSSNTIDAWLSLHPDLSLTHLSSMMLVTPQQEQQIRLNLQQVERLLNEAASALKTIQSQLTEHLQLQPTLSLAALLPQIESNLIELNSQIELRDQFKLKLELHLQNSAKQQQFAEQIQQIQQQEHRWSKISDLMGDANGKKFRDYAQQYHLDILIEYANQQLTMLSQRYTLKRLEHSLSLAIIDHDMDGETRSVASLSGGESFLTALALSLAIANMASGSMKIESLFIDEGFGTLDASSLHMVMNALDQLQSQGRKVVLISHISDMHERIPVQIQVNPRGAGASHIEVVG